MVQILIEMDENEYIYFKKFWVNGVNENKRTDKLVSALKNGTPLPKGHGRLIDASNLMTVTEYDGENEKTYIPYYEIENAPTIIEADKGARK